MAVMYWSVNCSMGVSQRQIALDVQFLDGLVRQIGIDGVGAVTAQQAEVHHLAWLAALDHNTHLAPQPPSQQAVMQRGCGQ